MVFSYFYLKRPLLSNTISFSITAEGECVFLQTVYCETPAKLQLNKSSRVCFLGCWLVFEKNDGYRFFGKKSPDIFVFRDSVDLIDYARLCRVINSL
jgi:hypothetical protein